MSVVEFIYFSLSLPLSSLQDKGRDAMRNLLSQKGYQDVMCNGITMGCRLCQNDFSP